MNDQGITQEEITLLLGDLHDSQLLSGSEASEHYMPRSKRRRKKRRRWLQFFIRQRKR